MGLFDMSNTIQQGREAIGWDKERLAANLFITVEQLDEIESLDDPSLSPWYHAALHLFETADID